MEENLVSMIYGEMFDSFVFNINGSDQEEFPDINNINFDYKLEPIVEPERKRQAIRPLFERLREEHENQTLKSKNAKIFHLKSKMLDGNPKKLTEEEMLSNKSDPYIFQKELSQKAMLKKQTGKKIYSNTEQIAKEMKLDVITLDPAMRYKKYLELLKVDNRMWSVKHHGMYLLSNNLMAFLVISLYFRQKYMPDIKKARLINNKMGLINLFLPRSVFISILYTVSFFSLYYYSRFYLYKDAYENFYGPKAINNKDFLDLYDTIMLKKKIKEFI